VGSGCKERVWGLDTEEARYGKRKVQQGAYEERPFWNLREEKASKSEINNVRDEDSCRISCTGARFNARNTDSKKKEKRERGDGGRRQGARVDKV